MKLILSILIGLSALLFTSCKPNKVQKERITPNTSSGSRAPTPSTPPSAPSTPPSGGTTPPPVTIPSNPDISHGEPPAGDIVESNETLRPQEEPTWNLCPGSPPSDPYSQSWIDSKFKSTKGQENFNILYSGVSKLVMPYIKSGAFLAYGEEAFAAMAVPGKAQASFATGAKYGAGKIFVFGHSEWLTDFAPYSPISLNTSGLTNNSSMGAGIPGNMSEAKDQVTYLKNVLIWLLGDSYKNLIGTSGSNISFLTNTNAPFHSDFKLTGSFVANFTSSISPATYPLVILGYQGLNDQDVTILLDYLKNGGRILIAVWPNYGQNIEYINKILKPTGISYYSTYSQSVNFAIPTLPDLKNSQFNLHSLYTLAALEKNAGSLTEIEKGKLESSLLPTEDPSFSCRIVRDFQDVDIGFPFKKSDSLFKYNLLLFRNYYGRANPADEPEIPPAQGVAQFPGVVTLGTPLVERDFTFNLKFSRKSDYREYYSPLNWQATGLYAPPGHTIKVEITQKDSSVDLKNFRLIINPNTDDLSTIFDTIPLKRHPLLTSFHVLKLGVNKIRNQFGGLIIMEGLSESNQNGFINLTISDAVEAPWLNEGTTDLELARMKTLSVPWGIIQGPRSVAVVPINNFRNITSAKPLRDAWTYFHVLEDLLTGTIENGNLFPSGGLPEDWPIPHKWLDGRSWHVTDIQIQSGEAHAGYNGYPVMYSNDPGDTNTDYATFFINPTKILSDGWTLWHERGHNHQQEAWTTSLDTEVTVNLLAAYMQDNGYKYLSPPIGAPPFRIELILGFKIAVNRLKTGAANIYQASGPICGNPYSCPVGQEPNNNDPYRRLIFFMQLIRFTEKNPAPSGKKSYEIISELYQRIRTYDLTKYKAVISSDQSKTDNLYRELSDITKYDLTDFFERWGRSLSGSVKNEVQGGYTIPPASKPIWKCDPYNPASDNPC